MNVFRRAQAFLFDPVSATGMGLLRIGWAGTCLLFFLGIRRDVTAFYSDAGVLPRELLPLAVRAAWRFSPLDAVGDPAAVTALYALLLALLVACLLGIRPRLTIIGSFLLLLAFQERNPHVLTGGDALLRSLGLLLCVSPGIEAFSLARMGRRMRAWRESRIIPAPPSMPAWPYRLLLWQLVLLYGGSLLLKAQGHAWMDGTAAGIALNHPGYARWMVLGPALATLSPLLSRFDLVVHAAWLCVLVPERAWRRTFRWLPTPKQWALMLGSVLHLGIWVFLTVGDFAPAMLAAYLGTLQDAEFGALRRQANARFHGLVTILYDGKCGLCTRTISMLAACDWLRRLRLADFRRDEERTTYASEIPYEALEREMHITLPDGRVFAGFDAFRQIAWHLPPLWIAVPLLYVPGVPFAGRRVYAWVAGRRRTCVHRVGGAVR